MIEVKSRDISKSMYDLFAKLKLSSEYGMMVRSLSDEDKELIKKAYKSEKSNIYVDTDSSQLGG